MTQSPGHPMPGHRWPYGLGDDQPDPRRNCGRRIERRRLGRIRPSVVDDEIGLYCPSAMPDRCTEVGRSSHPVLSREHRRTACAQAVSERRPLLRRAVTMARPARVRIRNRNPCTRARRRLLGWKVRLPLATAHSPYCVLRHAARHTGSPLCLPHATHSVSSVNFCVLLVTGAGSGGKPVAAVSPAFGRLFEGTDAGSPGQTPLLAGTLRRALSVSQRPIIHTGHTRIGPANDPRFHSIHLAEMCSRPRRNLLACLPAPFRIRSGLYDEPKMTKRLALQI